MGGCTCAYRFHKVTGSNIPPELPLAAVGSNSLSREKASTSMQQLRQSLSPHRHRSNESATSWFQRVITQLNADVVNFSTLNVVTRAKVCPSHVCLCCDVFMHSDKKIYIFLNAWLCNLSDRTALAYHAKEGNGTVLADECTSESPRRHRCMSEVFSAVIGTWYGCLRKRQEETHSCFSRKLCVC